MHGARGGGADFNKLLYSREQLLPECQAPQSSEAPVHHYLLVYKNKIKHWELFRQSMHQVTPNLTRTGATDAFALEIACRRTHRNPRHPRSNKKPSCFSDLSQPPTRPEASSTVMRAIVLPPSLLRTRKEQAQETRNLY